MFCWRAVHFCTEIERRFFDADSTDADASIDRGARNRSKTVEKIIAFAICLPNEIDALRFSGPEQFFAGAPYISVQKSNVVFSTPNRSMPMPRSIAVLENDPTTHRSLWSPNNVLLVRPIFLTKSNVVFRRRLKRSKTFEKIIAFATCLQFFRLFSSTVRFWISFRHFQFHFTSRFPRSPLYGHPLLFHSSFFPSFFLFFSHLFPFLFFSFLYSRDKLKCALATREKLVCYIIRNVTFGLQYIQ